MKGENTKQALVNAGIAEIRKHGLQNLSIRKVSAVCGMSCATPYRHFANRNELIMAIFRSKAEQWYAIQDEILKNHGDTRERITEISIAYIRFLLDNPEYRAIIFSSDDDRLSEGQIREICSLSSRSRALIDEYCGRVQMDEQTKAMKTFIVRSIIYSAAIMIGNGECGDREKTLSQVRLAISREFDLP